MCKLLHCVVGMVRNLGKQLILCTMALAALSGHAATVLWDEDVNGSLDPLFRWPTNADYFIHPIGTASDDVNLVRSSVTVAPVTLPFGYYYAATEDAFYFDVPAGRQLTGLALTEICDYSTYVSGGIYASATGAWDGAGQLPGTEYGWHATQVNGTNDIFAQFGISVLPSGTYSLNPGPNVFVHSPWDGPIPGPASMRYTLYIFTAPVPPTLQIAQVGTDVKLIWPTNNANGFLLQSTTNVATPSSWVTVTNEPALVADQFELNTPMLPGQQFFRLLKQ